MRFRWTALAFAAACLVAPASPRAQTPPAPPQAQGPRLQPQLVKRFDEANTTHDGKLTLAQAQAGGLSWVVAHFAQVDSGGKGYVTLDDMQAFRATNLRGPATTAPAARETFVARFNAANTTGDGHLTLAQASAGHMPVIARNFSTIDAAGKGYVTLADIQAFRRNHAGQAAAAPALRPPVPQPGAPMAGAPAPAARASFIDKFTAANTTGDGRLTLAQARIGRMPFVVKNFAAIDNASNGYVTLQDIRAYRQQMASARPPGPTQQ